MRGAPIGGWANGRRADRLLRPSPTPQAGSSGSRCSGACITCITMQPDGRMELSRPTGVNGEEAGLRFAEHAVEHERVGDTFRAGANDVVNVLPVQIVQISLPVELLQRLCRFPFNCLGLGKHARRHHRTWKTRRGFLEGIRSFLDVSVIARDRAAPRGSRIRDRAPADEARAAGRHGRRRRLGAARGGSGGGEDDRRNGPPSLLVVPPHRRARLLPAPAQAFERAMAVNYFGRSMPSGPCCP